MQKLLGAGEPDFFERCREVGDTILSLDNPLVMGHYDADGLSATALVANALKLKGRAFEVRTIKRVDDKLLSSIPAERNVVFVDLGSGQADLVEKYFPKAIIIDHHPPSAQTGLLQANPHAFGYDGATEASAASTAYFCFKHLDNPRIVELGIVGAVGDMQDQEGLRGLNAIMLGDSVESGVVLRTRDLRMFGRVSRPLVWFLAYCDEPFLPGLTNNDKACALFLHKHGISLKEDGKWVRYYDLPPARRKELQTALINYCNEHGVSAEATASMIGDVYIFLKEPDGTELRDAYEFSTLLNACGRHGKPELGISVCLGEAGAYESAHEVLLEHRRAIRSGIFFARKHAFDAGAFYFLDGRGEIPDTVIGTVAGAYFNSGLVERNKPILAFSNDEEGNTKVSSRGCKALIEKGLDLGEVMRKAGAEVGGVGGGHNVAAGCSFKPSAENERLFLKKAKEVIEVQLQLR
ncbi:DHHA1 domain protein [Candidatus Norongarragalina meridionalis]|nr:DHHA1 domain protein [Candidatus Norongarragalina meridionalis]